MNAHLLATLATSNTSGDTVVVDRNHNKQESSMRARQTAAPVAEELTGS